MEKSEKLEISNFDPEKRAFVEELRAVLEAQDSNMVEKHLELAMRAPHGAFDSELFKIPSTITLLIYGEIGLETLYKQVIADPLVTGHIWATSAILAVALKKSDFVNRWINPCKNYINDKAFKKLVSRVKKNCENNILAEKAREILSRLVNYFASEPKRRDKLGLMLHLNSLLFRTDEEQHCPAVNLLVELIAETSLNISDEICNELEKLIVQNLKEKVYQQYFENHPALLDPLASSIVEKQCLANLWKTDFVVRRLDDEYVFVEIESPKKKPFTKYPHPSSNLSHALGQILNWLIWVEDDINYAQNHGFPGIHSPRGIIVIGRDNDLDKAQKRMLKKLNDLLKPIISIYTYDDIIRNARNVVRN